MARLTLLWILLVPAWLHAEDSFGDRCAKAGGRYTGAACRCTNGAFVNPYVELCTGAKARPRAPEDLRAECLEYLARGDNEVPLSFARLVSLVRRENVTSTAGLLKVFQHDPVWSFYLRSHVLMHASESSQKEAVDPRHPRLIFHGRDLIFAFTAHPDHPAVNNRLEVIQYNRATHQYSFHELDFNSDPPRPTSQVSSCQKCHGASPRPIWNTYRIWPGAYTTLYDFRRRFPVTDGVYSFLEPTHYGEDSAQLNTYLNQLNFDRIEHDLRALPRFREVRHAAVASILGCPAIDTFLPGGQSHRYQSLVADSRQVVESRYREIRDRAREIGDTLAQGESADNDLDDVPRVAGLRFLFETGGLSLAKYSSNFAPGRATYGYGYAEFGGAGGGLRGLLCRFLPELMEADPALAPLAEIRGYGYPSPGEEQRHCALLRQRSLETQPAP